MKASTRAPLNACRSALILGLRRSAPGTDIDEKGYVTDINQNLVEGVRLGDFEADLRQGDGNEMGGKFRAAHSSSALAVNTFAPFKAKAAALQLPGGAGFIKLSFERKCPHGLVGRRSPNLDLVADGPNDVVAVESKCLEPLSPHNAKFAPAYESEIRDERRQSAWFREMQRLVEEPSTYRWLDVAQLVKHAFGLAYTFVDKPVTLLYLFWEPSNPEAFPTFAEHRGEIARFAASIRGDKPKFIAISYPELWKSWDTESAPEWLQIHVRRLRARYGVTVEGSVHARDF
jgi:hypothetical protein